MTEKLIYMAHPVRGNVPANRLRAMLWLKWLTRETKATVIAPWISDVALWDDGDPEARERGLLKCRTTLVRCDELWMVGGQGASDGMKREGAWALDQGLKLVDASMMPAPWESGRWSLEGDPMAQEVLETLRACERGVRVFHNLIMGVPVISDPDYPANRPPTFVNVPLCSPVPPNPNACKGCGRVKARRGESCFLSPGGLCSVCLRDPHHKGAQCKKCGEYIHPNHAAIWEPDGSATCCGCEKTKKPHVLRAE